MPFPEYRRLGRLTRAAVSAACLLLALWGAWSPARANDSDIRKKEKALQQLRSEIELYEKRIRESERKEKMTLERLDDMERQVALLQTLQKKLQFETTQLRSDIDTTASTIQFFEAQLSYLQQHYARYVSSVYKNGRVHDFETLLSSKSLNQLYIRLEYLKYFTAQRRRDVDQIREKKKLLEGQRTALEEKLVTERELLEEKQTEGRTLLAKKEARTRVLKDIRKDKTLYQKELARKTKAAMQLESLIADLIEKDRIRRERERRSRRAPEGTAPLESLPGAPASKPFAALRGQLMWPIAKGKVVAQFGEQVHPVLKTVTQNTGIDIAVSGGTPIRTVADGEVALIHWLPTYGSLVIVNHNGGYRTVYTHLSDIAVSQGQALKAGDVIAKSGDSVQGSLLHFEIWKDKQKQDPEIWLSRRH